MFDLTISLGNVITILSTVGAILFSYAKLKSKVENLEKSQSEMRIELNELRKSDRDQAVLTQRVLTLETAVQTSSLAVLIQRVNTLEKELGRMQELESFRRQNEPSRR